jgi:hypothetical protein
MKMTLRDSVVALWMKGQRRWGAQPTNGALKFTRQQRRGHLNGQP